MRMTMSSDTTTVIDPLMSSNDVYSHTKVEEKIRTGNNSSNRRIRLLLANRNTMNSHRRKRGCRDRDPLINNDVFR